MIEPLRIMVLDSETADLTGSVYDVGYCIVDRKGKSLVERNWLVLETFTNADKMMGAYFAKKLFTHYAGMLQTGKIALTKWSAIVDDMRWDCAKFKVNVLAAYNLAFDRRVMASTHHDLGYVRPILPPMKQLDIWRFTCEAKLNTRIYKDLAHKMDWVSEAGNIKTTAECAYRFCSGQWGFIEDHTALSDAKMEAELLAYCFRAGKKVPYNIVDNQPWRIVNS
jgi:hypothetical protein